MRNNLYFNDDDVGTIDFLDGDDDVVMIGKLNYY